KEAPFSNTKHQAPNSREAPSSKLEARAAVWSLELGISLVFGAWFLVFRFRSFSGAWSLVLGVPSGGSPRRFRSGPGVRRKDFVQRRMRHQLMAFHHTRDRLTDLFEAEPAIAERLDGDFIGGVQHGGHRAANLSRPARQLQGRKTA